MILTSLEVDKDEFERRTGWAIKPEGACQGTICVPLPDAGETKVDARMLSERLGMPLVADEKNGVWSLGPATLTGKALTTAEAPELVLPDWKGEDFRMSTLRGQKVLLLAWASW